MKTKSNTPPAPSLEEPPELVEAEQTLARLRAEAEQIETRLKEAFAKGDALALYELRRREVDLPAELLAAETAALHARIRHLEALREAFTPGAEEAGRRLEEAERRLEEAEAEVEHCRAIANELGGRRHAVTVELAEAKGQLNRLAASLHRRPPRVPMAVQVS